MPRKLTKSEAAIEDQISLRVRYADTDQMGVVYHARYFHYFESGRAELIRRFWKPYAQLEREGLILPVIEAHCHFYRGAEYDDLLTICTSLAAYTGARLRFEYRILRDSDHRLIAAGYTEHCFTDQQNKLRRMPLDLVGLLKGQSQRLTD